MDLWVPSIRIINEVSGLKNHLSYYFYVVPLTTVQLMSVLVYILNHYYCKENDLL